MDNTAETFKVLLVEDSKTTLKMLCNYLECMEIKQPLIAENGADAISLYSKEHPDIILLDIQLPDIDGYEIAKQIRALERINDWTAIIFLTGMTDDKNLARGIQVGGDDYLMKPVSKVVFQAKVKAMQRLVGMQRSLVDMSHQLNVANKELKHLSSTDALTGIPNRRMFDELSVREWRRCIRAKKPIAFVMVDIDNFKLFNDEYGHLAGDVCLREVAAQVSRAASRASDFAARYGGEEFVLVLGETDNDGAFLVAENIRKFVNEINIKHVTQSKHVTVSCGFASVMPDSDLSLDIFLKSTDHALYEAKSQGRDKVVLGKYGII